MLCTTFELATPPTSYIRVRLFESVIANSRVRRKASFKFFSSQGYGRRFRDLRLMTRSTTKRKNSRQRLSTVLTRLPFSPSGNTPTM
eukprot:767778-Hanusia_phi.AAC.3